MNILVDKYPDYKKSPTRTITIADFPASAPTWTVPTRHYFAKHHILISPLSSVKTVYPTRRGICFTMWNKVCFQERITDSHSPMRYWSPAGSPLGQVLYFPGYTPEQKLLFVVEGVTDALAVHQSGYNVCSLVGAKVSPTQIGLLRTLSAKHSLVIVPDNDEAGEQCYLSLQKELPIHVRYLPTKYKDICDPTVDDRDVFLKGVIQ